MPATARKSTTRPSRATCSTPDQHAFGVVRPRNEAFDSQSDQENEQPASREYSIPQVPPQAKHIPPSPPSTRSSEMSGRKSSSPIAKRVDSTGKRYLKIIKAHRRKKLHLGESQTARSYGVGSGKGGLKRIADAVSAQRNCNKANEEQDFRDLIRGCHLNYDRPAIHWRTFRTLVGEICAKISPECKSYKWQTKAFEVARQACDIYLQNYFSDCYCATVHAGRKTLMIKDMALTSRVVRISK